MGESKRGTTLPPRIGAMLPLGIHGEISPRETRKQARHSTQERFEKTDPRRVRGLWVEFSEKYRTPKWERIRDGGQHKKEADGNGPHFHELIEAPIPPREIRIRTVLIQMIEDNTQTGDSTKSVETRKWASLRHSFF